MGAKCGWIFGRTRVWTNRGSGRLVHALHAGAEGLAEREKCPVAGRYAARRGFGRPNLEEPPREWDAGGLSSKNQWNPIQEGIYGAKEGSEGAKATELCQS